MKGDAIDAAESTCMDALAENYAYRTLYAHGNAVGLNDGLMGNSEVGYVSRPSCSQIVVRILTTVMSSRHLNIGAGRIVWQDIVKIDVSISKRQFHNNPTILQSMKRAKDNGGRLHLLGLVCSILF